MKSKKEIIIGLCVVIALFALFMAINFLKGINVFKAANYYYATYTDAAGLQVSAPVTLNGFKVGQVRDINYQFDDPGHVKVELSLDRALRLPSGTKAVISLDLLGSATVVLKPTSATTYEKVGSTLQGETAAVREIRSDAEHFADLLERYGDISELTPEILNMLVEKIVVYEPRAVDGVMRQQLDVYYRYIGVIKLVDYGSTTYYKHGEVTNAAKKREKVKMEKRIAAVKEEVQNDEPVSA